MGAELMRKMGWKEGEGLGKNKDGTVEPIMVEFKTDRKGLVAEGEKAQKKSGNFPIMKDLSGKHPVSALIEICNKRKWAPPEFFMVHDSGPDHRKHFLFKVKIDGTEYQPNMASPNKKHAKATAATVALQAMGLVPKDSMSTATSFMSATGEDYQDNLPAVMEGEAMSEECKLNLPFLLYNSALLLTAFYQGAGMLTTGFPHQ